MEKKNAPGRREREVDTFTLRLDREMNDRIRKLADEIGISQNALLRIFVFLELKRFEEITPFQVEELHRVLSQRPK